MCTWFLRKGKKFKIGKEREIQKVYFTRSQRAKMDERLAKIEQENKELREIVNKNQQDLQKSVAAMMDMMNQLMKEKEPARGVETGFFPQTGETSSTILPPAGPELPRTATQGVAFTINEPSQGHNQHATPTGLHKQIDDNEETAPNFDDPAVQARYGISVSAQPDLAEKYEQLAEKLKQLEGFTKFPDVDVSDMGLVSGLTLPYKFKMPEFDKYNGSSCPKVHARMYYRRMTNYVENHKLMIHCFQESLEGVAMEWYIGLKPADIKTWQDLAGAFITHFQHMIEIAPTRATLSTMERKPSETFKEYAKRWREIASRVRPALDDEEFSRLFIRTLKNPYYDKLWALNGEKFSKVVKQGEFLESEIKDGHVEDISAVKKAPVNKRRDGETNEVVVYNKPEQYQNSFRPRGYRGHSEVQYQPPYQPPYQPFYQQPYQQPYQPPYQHPYHHPYQPPSPSYQPSGPALQNLQYPQLTYIPQAQAASFTNSSNTTATTHNQPNQTQSQPPAQTQGQSSNFNSRPRRTFTQLPVSYAELYPQLYEKHLVTPMFLQPLQPPYPKWYNPNLSCEYHNGAIGHDVNSCIGLKNRVQDLIDRKVISFNSGDGPDVNKNPLPEHGGSQVNMIELVGNDEGQLVALVEPFTVCGGGPAKPVKASEKASS